VLKINIFPNFTVFTVCRQIRIQRGRLKQLNKLCKIFKPRTAGYGLGFPATLFPVQSYGLYVADVWGGKFTQYQATCYVSKLTMVYDEGE